MKLHIHILMGKEKLIKVPPMSIAWLKRLDVGKCDGHIADERLLELSRTGGDGNG